MSRFTVVLMALALGLAACAHDHALGRRDVAAMLNDSPAISPWAGSVPSDEIPSYERGPVDEK